MPNARTKTSPKSKQTPKFDAEKLLLAIVRQVTFDGWTRTAMQNGAKSVGAEAGRLELTYPRGVRDVVTAFSAWANAQMLERIAQDRFFTGRRVRDKVAFAVQARLEVLTPYREAVRQLVLWGALPHHAPDVIRHVYDVCDAIWRQAGDTSTDFNFYTKRGLLAFVLKTTTLFWIADTSAGQEKTWHFLDRRIAEILNVGKMVGGLRNLPEQFGKLGMLADLAKFFRRAA